MALSCAFTGVLEAAPVSMAAPVFTVTVFFAAAITSGFLITVDALFSMLTVSALVVISVTPLIKSRLPPSNKLSAFKALILAAVNCKLPSSVPMLDTTRILVELMSTSKPSPPATLLAFTVPSSANFAASIARRPASNGLLTSKPSVLLELAK